MAATITAHHLLLNRNAMFDGGLRPHQAAPFFHGPDFYRLPRNRDSLTLEKQRCIVPEERRFGKETGVPLRAGGTSPWRLVK